MGMLGAVRRILSIAFASAGQHQDVIWGEDNLDISAAGGKTAYPGMTAKFEFTVHGQLQRLNVGRIGALAKKGFFFCIQFSLTHRCYL